MKIGIISFTERGISLGERIRRELEGRQACVLYTKYGGKQSDICYVKESLQSWTGRQFQESDALIFIGACGIAVRSIAPFVRDKLQDIPVLVLDEAGQFVIPVLSGHFGGANELAVQVADRLHAVPVLTTATDVNHLFAVDVFARKNRLEIADRKGIAAVSASLLDERQLTMSIAGQYRGVLPPEVQLLPYPPKQPPDVLVAAVLQEEQKAKLQLIPKSIVLGMGCRKGKELKEIEGFAAEELKRRKIPMAAVGVLATIDRKKEEPGLLAFAEKYGLRFQIYTAEELQQADGEFFASGFVEDVVGVDNVCERSAVIAAGSGHRLLIQKTAREGMTLAAAEKEWSVTFDET